MKKIFRLSAMVAMISMMATATVATSCSDDDDDDTTTVTPADPTEDWSKATSKITATPGATLSAKNEGKVYTVKGVSAEAGKVVVNINGNDVTLSDAGTSYLSINGAGLYQKDAKEAAGTVLMALSAGPTALISGTEVKDAEIASKANATLFK